MKIKSAILSLILMLPMTSWAGKTVTITVTNDENEQRQELVEIDLKTIVDKLALGEDDAFVVRNAFGQQVDYQVTYDGKLLIDVSVRPCGKAQFTVSKGVPEPMKTWVKGKMYPTRKDDIAWENDRGAYREVYYQKSLVDLINNNIRKIATALMVISLILLVIAIALIRNTIRLSIYSKRFTVRSMQLVGATEGFIRRPFLRSGVLQGFLGGLLADVLLVVMLYGISKRIPDLTLLQDMKVVGAIFAGIIVLGVVLAWFSTRSALNKFLKADLDKLYN